MKKQKKIKKLNEALFNSIILHYAEMCVERGYHPRYIGRRIRRFEDAFDAYWFDA